MRPKFSVKGSGLVPIGGLLPYYLELPTGKLLNVLIELFSTAAATQGVNPKQLRTKLNKWLYPKTRPGFYLELGEHLHLAYADQRHGYGTQHWWRLFFDEQSRKRIEQASLSIALAVSKEGTQTANAGSSSSPETATGNSNGLKEWGGMYFRSEPEIRIAQELDQAGVLFFANARGRVSGEGSPLSNEQMTGRIEVDFLVCHQKKCMILEVDGRHHQEGGQVLRDYVRDRVLLREGFPTVRFTAQECLHRTTEVVREFLNLLASSASCPI